MTDEPQVMEDEVHVMSVEELKRAGNAREAYVKLIFEDWRIKQAEERTAAGTARRLAREEVARKGLSATARYLGIRRQALFAFIKAKS